MDNLKNNICRGTIVFVKDLNKNSSGHAAKGSHPAVVVQNEKGNQHSPTLIVCYLTSQLKRLEMKTHVFLQHYDHLKLSVVQAEQLTDSVRRIGVMTPATVRKKEDGRYELISGHRRKRACELAGFDMLKCEVKELS